MAVQRPIYLDNHATTGVDPRVLEVMLPYFSEKFGNAASRSHAFGWEAEAAVERAREQVAALVGGRPTEIVFTSGATEANNLALKGGAAAYRSRGRHVITVATEHKAVLDPCARLEREGAEVTVLRPAADGLVSPGQVAEVVGEGTVLVSVMHANNEIGVLQPLAAIAAAVRDKSAQALIHSDAAQSAGKVPLDAEGMGLDLVSLSAHKLYGPKGVGALWVRRRPRRRLEPLLDGGGHERGLRSGTLPVPEIVGFGAACELAAAEMEAEAARTLALRERLREGLSAALTGVSVNGSLTARLPGNLHVSFAGVDGDALLVALRSVAVSSGSACTSATLAPSHVLRALGVDDELADGSIRFGIGRFNTAEEIDRVIAMVTEAVQRLRELPGAPAAAPSTSPQRK